MQSLRSAASIGAAGCAVAWQVDTHSATRIEAEDRASLERLKGKVPCAPVNTVAQAFADEQVVEDEMVLAMSHPDFGTVRQVASPVKISDYKKEHQRGPKLGEHTEEVLGEHLGLSHEEIEALRTEGVL